LKIEPVKNMRCFDGGSKRKPLQGEYMSRQVMKSWMRMLVAITSSDINQGQELTDAVVCMMAKGEEGGGLGESVRFYEVGEEQEPIKRQSINVDKINGFQDSTRVCRASTETPRHAAPTLGAAANQETEQDPNLAFGNTMWRS
jgi:hypothetical protein